MNKRIYLSLFLALLVAPITLAKDCLIPLAGDINGDCVVDIKDFELVARDWLKDGSMPQELVFLAVTDIGVNEDQTQALAESLGVPIKYLDKASPLLFLNANEFQHVPTNPLEDQELIARLTRGSEVEEEGAELAFPVLNTDALLAIKPISGPAATRKIHGTLSELGLMPTEASTDVSNSTFEAMDLEGQPLFDTVLLDTQVNLQTMVNDIPVLGPGQQYSFSFNGDGNLTQMVLARRGLSIGDRIPVKTATKAAEDVFLRSNGTFIPEPDIKLCYYAPPLGNDSTQTLIPHYDIGGTLYGAEGQRATKLRKLVPATDDPKYVPFVQLFVSIKGNTVTAATEYGGGSGPYYFQWFSSSTDLSQFHESSITYNAFPRTQSGAELVTVKLTDANGVIVDASDTVMILVPGLPPESDGGSANASTEPDFGVERGVGDLGAANQSGFVNRFQSEGIYKRFNWSAGSAWEQDFKLNGSSTSYIDQADIVFYIGHGYGGGFTFETTNDDKYLTDDDAVGAWGGGDLEWLTLLSCEVLKDSYGGDSWSTRWGPAFNGLHLLCGFQTTAYDWHNFGGRFADWTLGRDLIIINLPPIPVRSAWFQAKKEEQPNSVEAVVMGPLGPKVGSNWILGGYNDYFWGKGPVSSDLRGNNIHGYWRQVYK